MPYTEDSEERIELLRQRRTAQLLLTYEDVRNRYQEIAESTELDERNVVRAVECYLELRDTLRRKHGIESKIQKHKIAGLMATAIMKHPPIRLISSQVEDGLSKDNEYLAAVHGLAICAEDENAEFPDITSVIARLCDTKNFADWFRELIFDLSECSPDQSSGLIMTFRTISLTHFPHNFDSGE